MEKKEFSSYVTYSHPYTTAEGIKKQSYICHRSGFYVKKGKDMRYLKTKGSRKINGICPSRLKVCILPENGNVKINFIQTHIGHDNDLGHLNITKNEKIEIASKIASKIPLVCILDEIRDSVTNNKLERMHILTRKDLHNISQTFNLNSDGIRHKNEVISIESWIEEAKNSGIILYYKPQGALCNDFPCLKNEDFLLIVMHPGQLEVLDKYSEDVICIDGTHGLNAHDFELTTLLILDDMREGFPCCFMIGNRSDEEIMTIFFMKIKENLGRVIKPMVFMSDMAQYYYNAWLQIMTPAKFRLFCSWHVDKAWRKNLNKIDGQEQKVIVYKQLRTLLQETDVTSFRDMIQNFQISLLSSGNTQEFGQYFQKCYLHNMESWAYCYRLHAGINTNMSIERMHQTIKYLYLNGRQVRRLDKTINILIKLIKDKLFERLITLNKGKISSKLRELRKRHKTSLNLDMDTIVMSEMGWEIPSSSTNDIYLVQKNKPSCDCRLVCDLCQSCLHSYSCTCLDNSIRWNMCKHIHLVCQFMKGHQIQDTNADEEHIINTDEVKIKQATEQAKFVEFVSKSCNINQEKTSKQLEVEKQKLIEIQTQIIQNITTFEQLEAFKSITAPLVPTLRTLAEHSGNEFNIVALSHGTQNIPHNKKVVAQKRLFSTKKKTTVKKKAVIKT
ncbi:uncharacterized protein LOC126884365 [Diabrotica virgifera virgifera]|uniref:SWIM-type domain-containing protein n=1 Tax=Diabrotica virgifera virgifera TaxID=50390 RepID=A0ABM5K7T7_DIAVI|nr:uncharacterized protein LOC126884365 [Diabrotica virgifera virgifera]